MLKYRIILATQMFGLGLVFGDIIRHITAPTPTFWVGLSICVVASFVGTFI